MKKTTSSKRIPKVYSTTITLRVVHVGEFKPNLLSQLQGEKIISHLGQIDKSDPVEPSIVMVQHCSEEITLRDAKPVLGAFWENEE